ncbi:MAG: hypothetical protein INR72_13410 [Williamsia herbipolensis]|nr:hypothetical protein [Williamsia herbipolensis]
MPTSLLLGLLALCWLVVLVPMFARSREAVPQTDDGRAGFRVLRRGAARERSAERHPDDSRRGHRDETYGDEHDMDTYAMDTYAMDTDEADTYETDTYETDTYETGAPARSGGASRSSRYDDIADGARRHRAGRGGFDPQHAAETAAYRFRRRRTIVLVLVLAAVVSAVGAKIVSPTLWAATGVLALVIVGFLTYLSRQVRIEREVRARRTARLERARAIRPPASPSRAVSPYRTERESYERDEFEHAAQVPPSARRPGVVVDLDDDDPAFDDLEYYQPVEYRRAAGQ